MWIFQLSSEHTFACDDDQVVSHELERDVVHGQTWSGHFIEGKDVWVRFSPEPVSNSLTVNLSMFAVVQTLIWSLHILFEQCNYICVSEIQSPCLSNVSA